MTYVDENLMDGERVVYRTRLHPIILFWPVLTALIGILLHAWEPSGASSFVRLVGIIATVVTYLRYRTSEFAVTDKRVVIKVGWVRRHTLETLLAKVENLGVDQSISGRLFGFGTVSVTGTGGTKERFKSIKAPLVFRRHVQEQVETGQATAAPVTLPGRGAPDPGGGDARQERECPHCAEVILAKARVCKHCGLDVVDD